MKILLVDDDVVAYLGVPEFLKLEGHEVEAAANGHAALTALEAMGTSLPQAIVTDLYMPGMDGLELIRTLRQNPEWRNIPVIALSAAPPADLEKVSAFSKVHVLRKPVDLKYLKEALETVVK